MIIGLRRKGASRTTHVLQKTEMNSLTGRPGQRRGEDDNNEYEYEDYDDDHNKYEDNDEDNDDKKV